jgi:methylmalonyl-CoA/ethylmalonyl-CoA epimerase
MLENLKFHHIGIAVRSIEQTAELYRNAGFTMTTPVIDTIQNVRISFLMKNDTPLYELVEPVNELSPVNKTLDKAGV